MARLDKVLKFLTYKNILLVGAALSLYTYLKLDSNDNALIAMFCVVLYELEIIKELLNNKKD